MKKRTINEIIRRLERNEYTKDILSNMQDFIENFNLEEGLELTFRKYMKLSTLIEIEAPNRYYFFKVLNKRITEDDLDYSENKLFLRYIKLENELKEFLKEHQDLSVKVAQTDFLVNEILTSLEQSDINLEWEGKYYDTIKLLTVLSDKNDVEESIIQLIRDFKIPVGMNAMQVFQINVPSSRFLAEWINKIVENILNIEGVISESKVWEFSDVLMDVLIAVYEVIMFYKVK